MVILQTANCQVSYNEETKTVTQQWRGFTPRVEFEEVIVATLDFFKVEDNEASFILNDTRRHGPVDPDSVDWVTKEINPKLIQNGLCKMAIILPESAISSLAAKQFMRVSKEFSIGNFGTVSEAEEWLAKEE